MKSAFQLGDWLVDPQSDRILNRGEEIKLEPRAMQVLVYLAEHAGELVTREQILEKVWEGTFVSDEALTTAIRKLRQAFGDDSVDAKLIRTIPKKGYRLNASVSPVESALASDGPPLPAPKGMRRNERLAWAVAGVMAVALASLLWSALHTSPKAPEPLRRFTISLPSEAPYYWPAHPGGHALSPDGTRLVYVALVGGKGQLYLRTLDRFDLRPMPGTQDAATAFFSPDGEWVGFVTWPGLKLKKVSVHGGPPLTLCDAMPGGGAWGADDTIVFVAGEVGRPWGLARVSASGGEPEVLTVPDSAKGEWRHTWPQILPGGEAVLLVMMSSVFFDDSQIAVLSLKAGEYRTVLGPGYSARYAPSGHVVYTVGGALMAVPFDLDRLEITGVPGPVFEGILTNPVNGSTSFAFSDDGSLAYVPGGRSGGRSTLVSVDRRGVSRLLVETPGFYSVPRFSPDGQRVALSIANEEGPADIWIYELARGTLTRLTFEGGIYPVWSPDGRQIAFRRPPGHSIFAKVADGGGIAVELTRAEMGSLLLPFSWTSDGQVLILGRVRGGRHDVGMLRLKGEHEPEFLLETRFQERYTQLSPDGRWLAYTSDESGQPEVYVQPFPGLGGKWQISTAGGTEPRWSPRGAELFYRNGDKMMSVRYKTEPMFTPSKPVLLFERSYAPHPRDAAANYDVSLDGQRFIMLEPVEGEPAVTEIMVVLNWFDELKRLVPAN